MSISEWDRGARHFLEYWFAGLMNGLESLDEPGQEAILRQCGKACAESYTAEVFQHARKNSANLEGFLAILAASFPDASYQQLTPKTIRVRYSQCGCDLVKEGLIKSPLICGCSVYNLRENFERAWGIPASVALESSILDGAPQCSFLVSLEKPPK
jgi:hypothetical protein